MLNNNNHEAYKETEKYGPFKGKNTAPEKDLITDLLDKDFYTTILKFLKELKKDVEKVKKIMWKLSIKI